MTDRQSLHVNHNTTFIFSCRSLLVKQIIEPTGKVYWSIRIPLLWTTDMFTGTTGHPERFLRCINRFKGIQKQWLTKLQISRRRANMKSKCTISGVSSVSFLNFAYPDDASRINVTFTKFARFHKDLPKCAKYIKNMYASCNQSYYSIVCVLW